MIEDKLVACEQERGDDGGVETAACKCRRRPEVQLMGMGNASQTSVVCLHWFAPAKIESSSGHTGI